MFSSGILIYTYRHYTCRYDLCMGCTYIRHRPDRWSIRYRYIYSDQYADQYDCIGSDSYLCRDTYIRQLFTGYDIHCDHHGESNSNYPGAEHEYMYDSAIYLFTYRYDPACWYYLCMVSANRC